MPIVLAINENAAVLDQVSSILVDIGIEVHCAQSGTQGIELLRSIRPDLILTSADMKGDDTNTNIVEIIRHEDSHIPIMILSGDAKQVEKQLFLLDMSNTGSALKSESKQEALSNHHFSQLPDSKRVKPLVLIVDDAEEIGEELQEAFQSQDMKTLLAENGEEGFNLFLEHRPDLIMTDILMPKVSGVDLISKIREQDSFIPIVAVSGAVDNSSEPLIKAGANKVVAKPFEPDRLVTNLIDDCYINRVPSVLVIEDNLIVSKTMDFLLRKAGYKVSVVESGDEGLELMKNSPPFDLITLDVMMDGMDGYETCRMIRSLEDKAKREVSVVFVTGKDSIEERQKGFDVGGSEFISKDNLKGVLIPTVNRILRPAGQMNLKILVAIPEQIEASLVASSLRGVFKEVITVYGGEAALAMLASRPGDINLVLSAQNLPGISGVDMLVNIRQNGQLRDLPFVLLISEEERSRTFEFFSKGGTDIIVKPFMVEELQSRVRAHIERVFYMKAQQSNIEQMKDLLQEKDAIMAVCSHDLKTPLNAILGYTEMLTQEVQDKEVLKDLEMIEAAGFLLYDMVHQILDMYRSRGLKDDIILASVDIGKIVMDCIELNTIFAERKGVDLNHDIEEPIPRVMADALGLSRVINNLVSNSLKFTEKGGAVTIAVKLQGKKVEISVADTGVGMNQETIDELFKEFTKASRSGTNGEIGTGLGLMIAQNIMAQHNGTIEVISTPGKGSRFSFAVMIDPASKYMPMTG